MKKELTNRITGLLTKKLKIIETGEKTLAIFNIIQNDGLIMTMSWTQNDGFLLSMTCKL